MCTIFILRAEPLGRFRPILWSAGLINWRFGNPQVFRIEWLAPSFSFLVSAATSPAWCQQFKMLTFYRRILLAWGCLSWHGWPLVSLETDRRAVRSWGGWEWIGWQRGGKPCQTNNWLSEQAPAGLNHVLTHFKKLLLIWWGLIALREAIVRKVKDFLWNHFMKWRASIGGPPTVPLLWSPYFFPRPFF